jgi:hypothetical protein
MAKRLTPQEELARTINSRLSASCLRPGVTEDSFEVILEAIHGVWPKGTAKPQTPKKA